MKKFIYPALAFVAGAMIVSGLPGCGGSQNDNLKPVPVATTPQGSSAGSSTPAASQQTAGTPAEQRFFYLYLDTSGSMAGGKLRDAKTAIRAFLDEASPDIQFGLAVFSARGEFDSVELVPTGPEGRRDILQIIDRIQAGGGTPLGGALKFSADKLYELQQKNHGYGEYNLLIVTDGEPDSQEDMVNGITYLHGKSHNGAPICIYTIGYQLSGDHSLKAASVWYADAQNQSDLKNALKEATESEIEDLSSILDF